MIDVGDKKVVPRRAVAEGEMVLKSETIEEIRQGTVKKGDVLTVARTAGLNAVKQTANLIPMCHQIPITFAGVDFDVREEKVICRCEVRAEYKTGVEMEALMGVSTALLTVWDMVKYLEKDEKGQYPHTRITNIVVTSKEKGE